ncbi:MAG: hypothetical protein LBC04_02430 [Holosporaceae bacterium]|jgi:hypothetical protein|nr:hypothetical protein [Holosporaceae bacterium]
MKITEDDVLLDINSLKSATIVIVSTGAYDHFINDNQGGGKTLYETHKESGDFIMPLCYYHASSMRCGYDSVIMADLLLHQRCLLAIDRISSTTASEFLNSIKELPRDLFDAVRFLNLYHICSEYFTSSASFYAFKLAEVKKVVIYSLPCQHSCYHIFSEEDIDLFTNLAKSFGIEVIECKIPIFHSRFYNRLTHFSMDVIRLIRKAISNTRQPNIKDKVVYIDQSPWMAFRNKKFIEEAHQKLHNNLAIGYYFRHLCIKEAANSFLKYNIFEVKYSSKYRTWEKNNTIEKKLENILAKHCSFVDCAMVYVGRNIKRSIAEFRGLYYSCKAMFSNGKVRKCIVAHNEALSFAVMKAADNSGVPVVLLPHTKFDRVDGNVKSLPSSNYIHCCANEFYKKSFKSRHHEDTAIYKIIDYDGCVQYPVVDFKSTSTSRKKNITVLFGPTRSGISTFENTAAYLNDIQNMLKIPKKLKKYYALKFKNHPNNGINDVFQATKRKLGNILLPANANIHTIVQDTSIAVCFNYVGGGTFELFEHQIPVIILLTDHLLAQSMAGREMFGDIWKEQNFLQARSITDMWEQIELMTNDLEYSQAIIKNQNMAIYGQTTPKEFCNFADIL